MAEYFHNWRLPIALKVHRLGRLMCDDSYIRHGCMGIGLPAEGPEHAHIHHCKTSCALEPDMCRSDGHSSWDS